LCAPVLSYCTSMGCDTDPTICPSDWTCKDLASFGYAGQHMCWKP